MKTTKILSTKIVSTKIISTKVAGKVVGIVSGLMISASVGGCANSNGTFQSFLNQVEADLANGTILSDLEAVVVHYFPNLTGDAAAIDIVLQEAINLLVSSGVLPSGSISAANNVIAQIQAKLPQSKPQSKNVEEVNQIVAEISGKTSPGKATIGFLSALKRSL